MAVFNPQVPNTNDPNWLGWSKAISQPGADTSTGELLNTMASVGGDSVKFAANAMDEGVKSIAYDATRKLQDEHIGALEKADIAIRVADAAAPGMPTEVSSAGRKSVYDAPPQELAPREIRQLPNDLALLDSARGNGKISATAYEGRLVALAKDLRARYPGQRDLIDEEIQKVSNRDVANKYAQSLLGDINSFANAGKDDYNKVRNEIISMHKEGIPGADKIWTAFQNGQLGPPSEAMARVMQWSGPALVLKKQLEMRAAQRKEVEGVESDVARIAEDEANIKAKGEVANYFNALHLTAGSPTAQRVSEIIRQANAGEITLDEKQAVMLGRTLRQQQAEASRALDEYFDSVGPDGRQIRTILKAAKIEEIKKQHLGRFETVASLIESKEYGRAYAAMQDNRAMGDDNQRRLYNDKEMGAYFQLSDAVAKSGLDKYTKELFQSEIASKTTDRFKVFLKDAAQKMVMQPESASGVVSTLKQQVEELRKRTQGEAGPTLTKTYDGMISAIEYIADPKNRDVIAKQNLAKAAFDPSNLGLLTLFKEDSGSGPTYKPGKYSVYNRLFDDNMTKTVHGLGSERWKEYKDLGKQMWGRELFGPALGTLSEMQNMPTLTVGWDAKDNKIIWSERAPKDQYELAIPNTTRKVFKEQVDRLNNSLERVKAIAKAEGSDVNTFVLNWMKEFKVDIGKLPGIPQQLMKEIIKSTEEERGAAKTFEERYSGRKSKAVAPANPERPGMRDRALPYNVEDAPSSGVVNAQSGELREFLRNPVGSMPKQKPSQNVPQSRSSTTPRRGNLPENMEVISVEEVPEGMSPAELIRLQNERARR